MPVENYGVVIGPFQRFYRDPVDNEGKYLHGHVVVAADGLSIDCAVDCNHDTSNVRYLQMANLDPKMLGPVATMPDGYHALASNSTSGALDYARDPLISQPLGCLAIFYAVLNGVFRTNYQVWTTNVGDSAIGALQQTVTAASVERCLVFGARWNNPQESPGWGMHDIHCNQGDPPGSFQSLDGVWQDGGVIVRRSDGSYGAFLVMFTTQTLNTDDVTGLPK